MSRRDSKKASGFLGPDQAEGAGSRDEAERRFELLCKAMAGFSAKRFFCFLDDALREGASRSVGRALLTRALALSKDGLHFRELADGLVERFPGLLSEPSPRGLRPLAEAAGMGRFDHVASLFARLDAGGEANSEFEGRPALKEQLIEARLAVAEARKAPAALWTGIEGGLADTARLLNETLIPTLLAREECEALLEATHPQARSAGPRSI